MKVYGAYIYSYMDINKIFNLFGSGSEDVEKEDVKMVFIDFKDHPAYWLGMFKKLILNHKLFERKLIHFLDKADPEFDTSDIKDSGNDLAFERAWHYAQKFNINDEFHKESINLILDENLLKTLNEAIEHFQEKELYERCAYLKKIADEVKKLF